MRWVWFAVFMVVLLAPWVGGLIGGWHEELPPLEGSDDADVHTSISAHVGLVLMSVAIVLVSLGMLPFVHGNGYTDSGDIEPLLIVAACGIPLGSFGFALTRFAAERILQANGRLRGDAVVGAGLVLGWVGIGITMLVGGLFLLGSPSVA